MHNSVSVFLHVYVDCHDTNTHRQKELERHMLQCRLCRNETTHVDSLINKPFCNDECHSAYAFYREWKKTLYTPTPVNNHESGETFDDIIMRTGGYPVHCAHRGGGFSFAPENTMYAFRKSVANGARILELDIRLTKDRQLVLMHWSTIDETTSGKGAVSDYTLAELSLFDAAMQHDTLRGTGIRIATLREFLDEFVPIKDLLFFFDFKDPLTLRMTLKYVEPYRIHNRYALGSVLSTTNTLIRELRLSKSVPVCTDITQTFKITLAHIFGLLDLYEFDHDIYGFVLCPATSLFWTASLVDAIHKRGKRVVVSGYGETLSSVDRMKQAISFGADFIMTDRPDLLNTIL